MQYLSYLKAESVEDALEKLERAPDKTHILAGGTDLMVGFNLHGADPDATIVYIGELEALKAIECTDTELRIGSLVTTAQIAASEEIGLHAGALRQSALESAGPQVRNRATIGGNIATASPAGDMIAALYALDATVLVAGKGGPARVPISAFITGVKKTCLAKGQMILGVTIPRKAKATGSAFEKVGKRKAMTISTANAACSVTLSRDMASIEEISVAIGSASPTVVLAKAVEDALRGKAVDADYIRAQSRLAAEAINPITDLRSTRWYRLEVVPVLVYNTVMGAIAQARIAGGVA